MEKYRKYFYLFLITVAGAFLRLYKIGSNYYFSGELGKELLYMRQFALNSTLPLTGMATSHPWLSYGPIYYWIMIPFFKLSGGDPFVLFWAAFTVSIFGLILNYFVFEKIAGQKIAIFSTMIEAISPLLIWQTRLSKLHVFFWIIIPVFTYLLYLLWNGRKKWVFWTGVVFGILFSFHFSQIPLLLLPVLIFIFKKNIYKISDYLKFGLGLVIPNITLLWQDRNLALWLPYRVANIADKNPLGTAASLNEYFGKNIFWDERLWTVGVLVFAVAFVHYIIENKSKFKTDFLAFYLISSIGVMLLANMLHGAPPIHYFLPIFTTLPVLYGIYLSKFKFWPFVVAIVLLINLFAFSKDPLFYGPFKGLVENTDEVAYTVQNAAVSFILSQSSGRIFSIKRVGAYDYFPENYAQNYKYLALWKGGLLNDSSPNVFTVVEDSSKGEVIVKK